MNCLACSQLLTASRTIGQLHEAMAAEPKMLMLAVPTSAADASTTSAGGMVSSLPANVVLAKGGTISHDSQELSVAHLWCNLFAGDSKRKTPSSAPAVI